mmetsp:Transcript_13138/g.15912  ORF Transcript_13138/g.15912 Transcript_13138/m.15912 type:complete len:198 (+) Transcript_13138:254-847(+)|eukprot:CAMPEP_0197861204 /NCGR_PEP_ID=MMETSP1438-20131217/37100_1 /TAXON_ID=1461541 /ORGANISM="Pterosperma sp., Strain CCMP1384" /LENGTH=197 /DNA_ID=CAMNT_0043478301 /DNA_START=254 /DNA_END=847 /DNA_ORIENTATION=+
MSAAFQPLLGRVSRGLPTPETSKRRPDGYQHGILRQSSTSSLSLSSMPVSLRTQSPAHPCLALESISARPSSTSSSSWQLQATGSGGGVLDRPAVETPKRDFDPDTRKQRPPQYRVLLHNDNVNKREYVVQVLLKIIPGMTVDIAVNTMNEAHNHGKACVIVAPQEDAEDYCDGLRSNGLVSSIEPANKGGSDGGEP